MGDATLSAEKAGTKSELLKATNNDTNVSAGQSVAAIFPKGHEKA